MCQVKAGLPFGVGGDHHSRRMGSEPERIRRNSKADGRPPSASTSPIQTRQPGFRLNIMGCLEGHIWRRTAALVLLGLSFLLPGTSGAQEEPEARVHAVLFYSPTCPHCHALINDYLIPLQQEYGDRLVLLAFDVTQSWASQVYWAALRQYEVPQEDWVVPIMLLGDEILIGGGEIPNRLIQVLETSLPDRGVDLPNLPALLTLLDEQGMLDHRFPDRRIVVQEPDEEPPPAEEPAPQGAAGAPADPTVPGDTAAAPVDTAGPPVDTATTPGDTAGPPPDSVPVPAAEPAEVAGGDTVRSPAAPGVEADTPQGRVPETTAGDTAPEAGPESPADSSAGSGPAGAEPVQGPGEGRSGDTASATPAPRRGSSPPAGARPSRPTDLSGALQEMESVTMMDRFNQDRAGSLLAVVVLLVMLVSVALKAFPPRGSRTPWRVWTVPVLVAVGIGVAGYLTFIEVTHTEAVCGPVGDCNTVNQSEYATLFGFLPVGVLGLLGYAGILAAWALGRLGPEGWRRSADLLLWGAALLGTLFSIYLTFLEPFVIGATCAWCLTSALIMTLLLWATTPLAARAWPGGGGTDA